MNLGSVPTVPAGDLLLNSPVAPARAGTQAWTRDGRRFRLAKMAVATAAGSLMQSAPVNTGHMGLTPTADVAIGARTIRVTAGGGAGTNVPANTYAGGLIVVAAGAGVGASFGIKSHDAIVAATAFTVVLESDDPVTVQILAVSNKIDLIANPYLGIVGTPGTAATAGVVGLAVAAVDAGNWGFVQVEGLAMGIGDGAIVIGQAVSPSVTIASRVGANSTTLSIIGSAVKAGLANETIAILLNLP